MSSNLFSYVIMNKWLDLIKTNVKVFLVRRRKKQETDKAFWVRWCDSFHLKVQFEIFNRNIDEISPNFQVWSTRSEKINTE